MKYREGKKRLQQQRSAGVYINPDVPRVTAVIGAGAEELLAARVWELDPKVGLLVHCFCGQEDCPLRHQEIMPARPEQISDQIEGEIRRFCEEFGVATDNIHYGTGAPDNPTPLPGLVLSGKWLDARTVGLARAAWLVRAGKNIGESGGS